MIFHMTIIEPRCDADRVFSDLGVAGWVGVDCFFVLSGFLITGLLFDAKNAKRYFTNFYARRILRIFPLYYAVLIFALIILPRIHHPKMANFGRIAGDEWCYWAYLSNLSIAYRSEFRHAILDVSWSLAIEEQFYFIWPIAVALLNRRKLMGLAGVTAVLAFLSRIVLVSFDVHPIPIYVLTFCRVDALAVGAWLALLVRGPSGVATLSRWTRPLMLGSAVIIAALWFWRGWGWEDPVVQAVGFTLNALFFLALLGHVVGTPIGILARIFCWSPLRVLGKYSYALYWCHLSVRAVFRDLWYGPKQFWEVGGSQIPGQLIFYVLSIGASLVCAFVSWHAFEKHFLGLKRFFDTKREPRSSHVAHGPGSETPPAVCATPLAAATGGFGAEAAPSC
jgi:peptidoglycan/LPS O-acetylase OafA/YrhL